MHSTPTPRSRNQSVSRGFTLIEALVAIIVLSFGLISIANLNIVATTSNVAANRSSGATMLASQQMEALRSLSFTNLLAGATAQMGVDTLTIQTANFSNLGVALEGVGVFDTTWRIQPGVNANVLLIQVRTEPRGFRGRIARAEFMTLRTCAGGTTQGCPL